MVTQVSTSHQVHHKVKHLPILEGIVHVHDERTADATEQRLFVDDTLYALLSHDAKLAQLLTEILTFP